MKNRIRELRKAKKMTIEKLAEELDTSKGMISMLEKGDRRLNSDWIEKLSKVFDCSNADIIEEQASTPQTHAELNALMNSVRQKYSDDSFISPLLQSLEAAVKERESK